jgi:hypothetical protein
MVLNLFYADGFKDLGSFRLTLEPAKDYRVIFEVVGNTLHGQVFEVTDVENGGVLGAMVADQFRDLDANPPSPDNYDGNAATPDEPFDPTKFAAGFSGVYGVGHAFTTDADFTIDNFRTESINPMGAGQGGSIPEPTSIGLILLGGMSLWLDESRRRRQCCVAPRP